MTDPVKLLSDDEVAEIEARHNAASPGPWSMTWNTNFGPAIWSDGDILVRCEAGLKHSIVSEADPTPQWRKDMDFIRAAREDIPALCATVLALRAEIADYEQTDLIPRSRYEAADADREEARQQFRDIAKKATVEIERLEAENTALREQLAENARRHFDDARELERQRDELKDQLAQVTQERASAVDALKEVRRIVGAPEIGADNESWIDDIIEKANANTAATM